MTRNPTTPGRFQRLMQHIDQRPWLWLLLGGALLAASQLRYAVAVLAWFAPIPWLRHLRLRQGLGARAALFGVAFLAWELVMLKIMTAPLPKILSLFFAVPVALALTLPYSLVPSLRRWLGEGAAVIGFGTLMVSSEWLLHVALPLGTWGDAANTQLEQLALLQLASITGLHGVSFLIYVAAASMESWLASRSKRALARLGAIAAALVVTVIAGEVRLMRSTSQGQPTTRVAAVKTTSTIGRGPMPSDAELAAVEAGLFQRTRAAARAGARLVVWPEAATLIWERDEAHFLKRVSGLARELRVSIVPAYIVPHTLDPLSYANRSAWITSTGEVDHIYDKHIPVPVDPTEPSTLPLPLYESEELGRVSEAICYDYDFPRLALKHAALDVDLVALPSSDWRGIDPIHTQMAAVRAIEGGHSILRSARWGLSAGIDPYGRPRGWMSDFDQGDGVLVVDLPRHGVTTVYGTLGDWFPIGCVALSALALLAAVSRRRGWYSPSWWQTPYFPSPAERSSTRASVSASTSPPS